MRKMGKNEWVNDEAMKSVSGVVLNIGFQNENRFKDFFLVQNIFWYILRKTEVKHNSEQCARRARISYEIRRIGFTAWCTASSSKEIRAPAHNATQHKTLR